MELEQEIPNSQSCLFPRAGRRKGEGKNLSGQNPRGLLAFRKAEIRFHFESPNPSPSPCSSHSVIPPLGSAWNSGCCCSWQENPARMGFSHLISVKRDLTDQYAVSALSQCSLLKTPGMNGLNMWWENCVWIQAALIHRMAKGKKKKRQIPCPP